MGIIEKIQEVEREMARTQKNKATEYHLGLLKAKLAKYRHELLEPTSKSSSKGEGFDVMKSGDARVALVFFKFYLIFIRLYFFIGLNFFFRLDFHLLVNQHFYLL